MKTLAKFLFFLAFTLCLTSCVGIFALRDTTKYNYQYMARNQTTHEVFYFYEDIPYDKGDTIVLFPKKTEIVILSVMLNEQRRQY